MTAVQHKQHSSFDLNIHIYMYKAKAYNVTHDNHPTKLLVRWKLLKPSTSDEHSTVIWSWCHTVNHKTHLIYSCDNTRNLSNDVVQWTQNYKTHLIYSCDNTRNLSNHMIMMSYSEPIIKHITSVAENKKFIQWYDHDLYNNSNDKTHHICSWDNIIKLPTITHTLN